MTRNTLQTPDQFQARITLAHDALERIAADLTLCGEEIAKHGLFVNATVFDSHRKPHETRKPNPYLRAQRELLRCQKTLQRYLLTLEQQLQTATATEPDNEWAEF